MTTQEKILAIFEKHRETPGAPYEEANFLDFLLAKPKQKRAVYNSFRGLRRFNAFINDIQAEFVICFSLNDREANYSLDRFMNRVEELRRSPRSSLASLKYQMGPTNWNGVIFLNVILLTVTAFLSDNGLLMAVCIFLIIVINISMIRFYKREQNYKQGLMKKIKALT